MFNDEVVKNTYIGICKKKGNLLQWAVISKSERAISMLIVVTNQDDE